MSCNISFPTRIGGLDHMRSKLLNSKVLFSFKASSTKEVRICFKPAFFAFSSVSSSARSFTSTATISASGDSKPIAMLIGPHPHPISRNLPFSGGFGACFSSTDVPRSSLEALNTPFETCTTVS